MARHKIHIAGYRNFSDYEQATHYVNSIDHKVVIKASGLAAGKGVIIPKTKQETLDALKEVMIEGEFGDAGDEVVVE